MTSNASNYVIAGKIASTVGIGVILAVSAKAIDSSMATPPAAVKEYIDKHGDMPSYLAASQLTRHDPDYQKAIQANWHHNARGLLYSAAVFAAAAAGLLVTWRSPLVEKTVSTLGRSI